MKRTTLFILPLTLAMLSLVTVAHADVTRLADGQPWNADNGEGRSMTMTLAPDGTGRMKMGIMSRKVAWRDADGALCLNGLPGGGERCMALQPVQGGYRAEASDGTILILTR
ncbi:hypothetical protein [uncultured Tateyamaria sp.]|uniref:hypothetical protein n=1 Tax=uncultured Tateyamaria sp. TaxID=455651 RepID=UPI002618CEB4|nr:hypothetical protein [uncultured Tateyamaria sp.]